MATLKHVVKKLQMQRRQTETEIEKIDQALKALSSLGGEIGTGVSTKTEVLESGTGKDRSGTTEAVEEDQGGKGEVMATRDDLKTPKGYRHGVIKAIQPVGKNVVVKVSVWFGIINDENTDRGAAKIGLADNRRIETEIPAEDVYSGAKVGDKCYVELDEPEKKIVRVRPIE